MVVVDVETTGLNSEKHSLLSIGAVDMNDISRQFYDECRIWDGAHIMEESLEINGFTEEQAKDRSKKPEGEMLESFFSWFKDSSEQTLVGHNLKVDYSFLESGAVRNHIDFPIAKRTIDIHSLCYMHITKRGLALPKENQHSGINSAFICTYVGIPEETLPHNGLNGALWEAEAVSRLLYDKKLLPQYKNYGIPWF